VPDCDATYQNALDGGGESLQTPTLQDWGERTANVKDKWGNCWYIATFQGKDYFSEGAPTVQPFLQPLRAEPVIDFLTRAFGAVELGRATGENGGILHTTLKIGNSAMELSDAAGIYRPLPGTFYLYMDDADAVYERAAQCGATGIGAPVDQSYGDRMGTVRDVAGNTWHIAARLKQGRPTGDRL
jgi:PhnB protein